MVLRFPQLKPCFKASATALKKQKGWYGDEEYTPNAGAFVKYLDDALSGFPPSGMSF
jgi:hypothetical protein